MAFFHSCVLLLTQLVPGFTAANAIPVGPDSSMLRGSYAAQPLAASDDQTESLGREVLALVFAVDKAAKDAPDSSESTDVPLPLDANTKEEPTIPGAFVAVIFGVFGLLVIARRSHR